MAKQTSQINIAFLTKGEGEVAKAFKRLRGETTRLNRDFKSLSKDSIAKVKNEFNKLGAGARNSLNAMQAQRNALNGLRNMADVTSVEFKQLTADIAKLDAQMRKAGVGATGFKSKLKGFAKGAGAIAAGGIFGGVEGALGAGIGLATGGPVGAAVGAAVGAQVGMVRQQVSELAEYSAALGLQRKALRLVIGNTNQFNKSQKFLLKTSRELAIPQDVITRQFTSLTASVVGAGKSVSDAEKVFEAIAAGIRGTGGNLEDMKAAMRATSQVFSKGKVSAEELRQQLGERLPGAFTLFAESMGKTPAELDKALEQGKVTLDDFMMFANSLFDRYGKNARVLAQAPEAAGDRLKTQTAELKDAVGKAILPLGAAFQTAFSDIAESIAKNEDALEGITLVIKGIGTAAFATFASIRFLGRSIIDLAVIAKNVATGNFKGAMEIIQKGLKDTADQAKEDFATIAGIFNPKNKIPKDFTVSGNVYDGLTGQFKGTVAELNKTSENETTKSLNNIQKGAKAYFDTISDFGKQTQDAVVGAFKGMEDALVKFVMTGKLNFADLTRSILADMTRIIVRQSFISPLLGFFGFKNGGVVENAMGNVYDAGNKISKFAYGGIVKKPTLFPMAQGMGLMGEAGPEGILPLKRGKDGKLGVISQGGGVGNIVVNVDASGSSVEGDDEQSQELGLLLATTIRSTIIDEQRPGGLLS